MSQNVTAYTVKLTADTLLRLPTSGFGYLIDAIKIASGETVRIGTDDAVGLSLIAPGDRFMAEAFSQLYLLASADATIDLRVALSPDVEFSAGTIQVGSTVTVTEEIVSSFDAALDIAVGAGATVEVAAADSSRRLVGLKNPLSAPGPVRIGGASAGAGAGWEVEPGEAVWIPGTTSVRIHNPQSSSIDIQRLTAGV